MFNRGTNLVVRSHHVVLLTLIAMFGLFSSAFAIAQTTVSPSPLNFGDVAAGTTSAPQALTLKNTGSTSIKIDSLALPSGSVFALTPATTCPNPGNLGSGASCTIAIKVTATGAAIPLTKLTITTSARNSPQTVVLEGTEISPTALSPVSLSFGNVVVGQTSAVSTVKLTNNNQLGPLNISSLTLGAGSPYSINAPSTTCPNPGSLGGGLSCTIGLTLTPTTMGAQTGTLSINDNAVNSPQTVPLTGSATAPPIIANPGSPYTGTAGQPISFSGAGSTGPAGQTLSYAWNFGDGTTGTGVSPTHAYANAANYTVSLTVTDGVGGSNTATTTAQVLAQTVANPGGAYTGTVGQPISFSGAGSTGPSGQTLSYMWNFGDGTTGTGVSPTHAYTIAGTYTVSLTVTDGVGGSNTTTTTAKVLAQTVANPGGPYTGTAGQAISFSGTDSTGPTGQTLSYAWNFGDGTTGTGVSPTHAYTIAGSYTVSLTVTASGGTASQAATTTATVSAQPPPAINGFAPTSGTVGTVINVSGTNLAAANGSTPQVALAQQGGGTLNAPVSTFSASSLAFVIPPGAATGSLSVTVGNQSASSSGVLTVTTSSTFTLGVSPGTGQLIPGQSTALSVTLSTINGFNGTVNLSVTGVPSGVTASFQPTSITVGQTGVLTLSAPANQGASTSSLTITGSATVQGQSLTQSATASVQVVGVTTSFLGRTVVDDAQQEPIAGVTVMFMGKDDKGNSTGCSNQTVTDGGGNFQFTNLPIACTGPQLISYNGMTATSPAGKYAGVNLSYTLKAGQAVNSGVLIHLPRIDNAETVEVQQNYATDQIFYFQSIPGLKVTVYAHTTLSLDDGSTPNPFPLVGIEIPLDKLPDAIPTSGMLTPFIVAFQPANSVASQPVAVNFPNSFGTAPGTHVAFVTLDPTHGYMVPYGTGTVSSDGTEFTADADPSHPGHGYGLVHFDWHGPQIPQKPSVNPSPEMCPCNVARPVDVSSGIVHYTSTDLQISSGRGSIAINRYYRTLTTNPGPFGIGTSFDYSYALDTQPYLSGGSTINLAIPDGNQFVMSQSPSGAFVNSVVPALRGAALTVSGSLPLITCTLSWANGTQFIFTSFTPGTAYLTSIVDLNGNTIAINRNSSAPTQILAVTDPVSRSLTFTYDSSNRITQITDPIGRKVLYTYNSQGTLATFTDANGGVTSYTYDSSTYLATVTDPRGVVTEQNIYNDPDIILFGLTTSNGIYDGRVVQQVEADGGVYKFSYGFPCGPFFDEMPVTLVTTCPVNSPVLQTRVTDPRGNQTLYRFNTLGLLVSVTDASGQTRTLTRDPFHNNLVSSYTGAGTCPVCGDPTAGNVSFTFDQFGNTLTSTDALGNTTTFTYDTRFNKVNSITDPLNETTKITYDANGNPTAITDANGNTTQLAFDSFGELIQITDPVGAKTMVAYDSFGNISSVTDALGHTSNLIYDAVSRLTRFVDALGRNSTAAYDALDRLTSLTDPLSHTTSFTYDPIGDLLSFKDARGNATRYSYDSVGRLQTRTSPLGKSETYSYDVDSNLIQYTDRRGQVSTFQYDALNRLVQENYSDANVTRSYDANSRLIGVNDSQGGVFGFAYDGVGDLLSQQEPTGTVNYTRDALGRVATRQVAGQAAVQYAYDSVGNMLNAATSAMGVSYKYDARGLPLSLTRTNGVVTNYAFDALGQVLSIIHSNGPVALNTQNYTYDAVGNRSVIGNDISQALITQSANATVDNANELLTNGGTAYTYDANGNRLTETSANGTLTYTWDGRNRLSSIRDASGNTTKMQYDFLRNLLGVSQSNGAATARQSFVVDSLTNVASLTTQSGTNVSVLTGQSIDSHFASVDSTGNIAFGIGDALGSTAGVTDSSGNLAAKLDYEPYGQTSGTVENAYPFAYTGRVPILGNIIYYRNRFYDPAAGRFLSEDPIGLAGGLNAYEYANDNPVRFNDPLGLDDSTDQSKSSLWKRVSKSFCEGATYLFEIFETAASPFPNPLTDEHLSMAAAGIPAIMWESTLWEAESKGQISVQTWAELEQLRESGNFLELQKRWNKLVARSGGGSK